MGVREILGRRVGVSPTLIGDMIRLKKVATPEEIAAVLEGGAAIDTVLKRYRSPGAAAQRQAKLAARADDSSDGSERRPPGGTDPTPSTRLRAKGKKPQNPSGQGGAETARGDKRAETATPGTRLTKEATTSKMDTAEPALWVHEHESSVGPLAVSEAKELEQALEAVISRLGRCEMADAEQGRLPSEAIATPSTSSMDQISKGPGLERLRSRLRFLLHLLDVL